MRCQGTVQRAWHAASLGSRAVLRPPLSRDRTGALRYEQFGKKQENPRVSGGAVSSFPS